MFSYPYNLDKVPMSLNLQLGETGHLSLNSLKNFSLVLVSVAIMYAVLLRIKNVLLARIFMTGTLVQGTKSHLPNAHTDSENYMLVRRFTASFWKFSIYAILLTYGIYAMHDQKWLMEPLLYCSNVWPGSQPPPKILIYYFLEMIVYSILSLTIQYDPKASDRFQMYVHHATTLVLITVSFTYGFLKYGVILMAIHDIADPFLELCKMFVYVKKQRAADLMFGLFGLIFIGARLILYPLVIVYPVTLLILYFRNYPNLPWYSIMISYIGLVSLQIMNIIWTVAISRVVINIVKKGAVADVRDKDD